MITCWCTVLLMIFPRKIWAYHQSIDFQTADFKKRRRISDSANRGSWKDFLQKRAEIYLPRLQSSAKSPPPMEAVTATMMWNYSKNSGYCAKKLRMTKRCRRLSSVGDLALRQMASYLPREPGELFKNQRGGRRKAETIRRNIYRADSKVRQGKWSQRKKYPSQKGGAAAPARRG